MHGLDRYSSYCSDGLDLVSYIYGSIYGEVILVIFFLCKECILLFEGFLFNAVLRYKNSILFPVTECIFLCISWYNVLTICYLQLFHEDWMEVQLFLVWLLITADSKFFHSKFFAKRRLFLILHNLCRLFFSNKAYVTFCFKYFLLCYVS